jgi:hypothetical protein
MMDLLMGRRILLKQKCGAKTFRVKSSDFNGQLVPARLVT